MAGDELVAWLKKQTLKTGTHYTLDDLAILRELIARLSRSTSSDAVAWRWREDMGEWNYTPHEPSSVQPLNVDIEALIPESALTSLRARIAELEREVDLLRESQL